MSRLLSLLLLIPLFGALVVAFMPRQWVNGIRRVSLGFMLVELLVSTSLLDGDYSTAAYQFVESAAWIPAFGIRYELGVDGISLWLLLLTTLLTPYLSQMALLHLGYIGKFSGNDSRISLDLEPQSDSNSKKCLTLLDRLSIDFRGLLSLSPYNSTLLDLCRRFIARILLI